MNTWDLLALAGGLGVGGAVGAAMAVLTAGRRLTDSFSRFRAEFEVFLVRREPSMIEGLVEPFESLKGDLGGVISAVDRLRRALRIR